MASTAPALPAAANRLVGRSSEIAEVDAALRAARLVTVTGPGGVGKTRLALEFARRRARRSETAVFVDLSALRDERLVPTAFAEALGLPARVDAMDDVIRFLRGTKSLVVVDNCEHVVAAAARAVSSTLEGCPTVRILATSREALRIPGETVWPLAPLSQDRAVELFVERAEAVRPDAVGEAEGAIAEICARLEGLPLAIELAAARVSVLSPAAILTRLGDRLDVLSADLRETPARHRSLRATLEWSLDLLDPAEKQGFARLAIFPGSFSIEAAEAVAGIDLDALAGLVAKSLVAAGSGAGGELRYRLLDVVRAFGRELLSASGEPDELAARHLSFFVELSESVHESSGLGGADAQARALADEIDNLRAALEWASEDDPEAGLRLIGASRQAWYRRSPTEGLAWATRLLETHPAADRARALGLLCAGHLTIAHHDHAAARARLGAAAELAEQLHDTALLAAALHYLALSGMLSRDLDAAEREITRSIDLFRQLDQAQGVGRGLGVLGLVRLYRGDPAGAAEVLDEAIDVVRGCDDAWGQGQVSLARGLTAKAAGEPAAALDHLCQAARVLGSTNDATILGVALTTIAGLIFDKEPARALQLAGAAAGLRERTGGGYPPGTVSELETIRRRGNESVGERDAQAEWQAGRQLDPVDAVALVEGRPSRQQRGPLTARQLEIARLVAEGLTNAQIASRLYLSERTVENHVFNALRTLGLQNRVQLATWVADA